MGCGVGDWLGGWRFGSGLGGVGWGVSSDPSRALVGAHVRISKMLVVLTRLAFILARPAWLS